MTDHTSPMVGSSRTPYEDLISLFEQSGDLVLEIEVLPSSIPIPDDQNFIQDGTSLGIPKRVLAQAFLRAREVFAKRTKNIEDDDMEVFHATYIILLFDPEYLTAANYRKEHYLSQPATLLPKAHIRELNFLNSILLSPLHRQSKSPTLWHHRLWLMTFSFHPPTFDSLIEDVGYAEWWFQGIFDEEIDAVFRSGERHANNYYAWGYARGVVRFMDSVVKRSEGGVGWPRRSDATGKVLMWCKAHPSDTSGWSFLLFLLLQEKADVKMTASMLGKVLKFAEDVKWEKEALWHFLRTAVAGCKFESVEEQESMRVDFRKVADGLDSEGMGNRNQKSLPTILLDRWEFAELEVKNTEMEFNA